jgi:hypothetical protein
MNLTNQSTGFNGIGAMLVPEPWHGEAKDIIFSDFEWIKSIPGNVYVRLFERWPGDNENDAGLPEGYDAYILSFQLEPVDLKFIKKCAKKISAPIFVLSDATDIDYPFPDNIIFITYYYWHKQLDLGMKWFPRQEIKKSVTYKASAICNRITQSKMLITTALLEEFGKKDCMIKLGTWLEEKNVHFRQPTGNTSLDDIADIFWKKYFGTILEIDQFDNATHNYQQHTINPWIPLLQDVALHFTNETYAYSYMRPDGKDPWIEPGPFLTEKTLKCLLSGTAFVANGQADTYSALSNLGLKFDYNFDLSWDKDIGNLSRLSSIIQLICWLKPYSAMEIFEMTKNSTEHNFDHVWSGEFYQECERHNFKSIEQIFSYFNNNPYITVAF